METIAAYAQDMSEFLKKSELTERRAFIETFVKEIVVVSDNALMRYTIPMPEDSRILGRNAEDMALNGSVLSTVKNGGPLGISSQAMGMATRVTATNDVSMIFIAPPLIAPPSPTHRRSRRRDDMHIRIDRGSDG
ncbi:MAG: hypothetical protein J4G14_13245 [Dehalococcoidia bacterium]|nr:hypothetical protein [Dehalococcoidia bacterium]